MASGFQFRTRFSCVSGFVPAGFATSWLGSGHEVGTTFVGCDDEANDLKNLAVCKPM